MRVRRLDEIERKLFHLDDTFLSDVSGYAPWCGWFTSNQSTSAHIAPPGSAEGLTAFTVISGPPDLSLTVSPVCICALSAMLRSSVLARVCCALPSRPADLASGHHPICYHSLFPQSPVASQLGLRLLWVACASFAQAQLHR